MAHPKETLHQEPRIKNEDLFEEKYPFKAWENAYLFRKLQAIFV